MKFSATVSRMAKSLDTQTRLMRVELDLPNPTGKIYHGMYGQVTIVLEKGADLLSIPSPCISSKGENGKATVYVVNKAGRAEKKQVVLGMDSGLRVAVLNGLSKDDQVILNPSSDLSEQSRGDGRAVGRRGDGEGIRGQESGVRGQGAVSLTNRQHGSYGALANAPGRMFPSHPWPR